MMDTIEQEWNAQLVEHVTWMVLTPTFRLALYDPSKVTEPVLAAGGGDPMDVDGDDHEEEEEEEDFASDEAVIMT